MCGNISTHGAWFVAFSLFVCLQPTRSISMRLVCVLNAQTAALIVSLRSRMLKMALWAATGGYGDKGLQMMLLAMSRFRLWVTISLQVCVVLSRYNLQL